jgi:hypothetical protein
VGHDVGLGADGHDLHFADRDGLGRGLRGIHRDDDAAADDAIGRLGGGSGSEAENGDRRDDGEIGSDEHAWLLGESRRVAAMPPPESTHHLRRLPARKHSAIGQGRLGVHMWPPRSRR